MSALASDCKALIEIKAKLVEARLDRQKDYYLQRCNDLASRINHSVYALYDLTEAEIALIESSLQPAT
jgi:hypothetical protein